MGRERAATFAAVAIGLTAWLLIETAYAVNVFESKGDAPRIHERYLFYLLPLFLTALVVAVRDERIRSSRLAFLLATVAGVVAVLAIPFQTDINGTIVADSFSFEIFARNGTCRPSRTRPCSESASSRSSVRSSSACGEA